MALVISAIVLGGILFFVSSSLVNLADSRGKSLFFQEIYSFRQIFQDKKLTVLVDASTGSGSDILLFSNEEEAAGGIVFGVVNVTSQTLMSTGSANSYQNTALAYREVSSDEIADINLDLESVYNLRFFPDKIFSNLHTKELQVTPYNLGELHDIEYTFFTHFSPDLLGSQWSEIPRDDVFFYTMVY